MNWREAAIDTASGTCAGIAQVAIGHPLDTIKIRMQTQSIVRLSPSTTTTTTAPQFDGIASTLRTTLRTEGPAGLFKGAASPLCGAMLQNASGFLFWGISKKLFQKKDEPLSGVDLFKAGLVVGVLCLLVENPVDLVKTQMQVQVGTGPTQRYRSVFDCGAAIVRQRGLSGLYQAVFANSLRFVPGRAIYLSTFEGTNRWLQNSVELEAVETDGAPLGEINQTTSYVRCFLAGGIAGGAAWLSTYPFDVIRNIMMGDHICPSKRKYSGVWHCGSTIVKNDGVLGLWRGLSPCLLRAIPVNGCIFVMYTKVNEELTKTWNDTMHE